MNTRIHTRLSRIAFTGFVAAVMAGGATTSHGQNYGPSFDVSGYQVTPFYESTPTGRTDDNGVPATDRFGWAESSSAVGISISLGGSSRSVDVNPDVLADALRHAAVPEELRDPAFARYVDLVELGQAWDELDPVTLTDIALQLAEGERVLHREHRAVKSSELFQIAIRMASDRRDENTLDRLQKYFQQTSDKTQAEQLAVARKLAGEARADIPGMTLSLDETTPESYGLYRGLLGEIKAAGYAGNKEAFDELDGRIKELPSLTDKQREYLQSIMGQTRSALSGEETPEVAHALDKLMMASRNDQGREMAAGILQIVVNALNNGANGQAGVVSSNLPQSNPINNGGTPNDVFDPASIPIDNSGLSNDVLDPTSTLIDNGGPSNNGNVAVDNGSSDATGSVDGTAVGVGGLNLRKQGQRDWQRQATQQPTRFRHRW